MRNEAPRSPFSVAGIQFVHEGEPGIPLPRWITPTWPGSRVVDEPIRVFHTVGSTSTEGLQPVVSTTLPHGEYFIDDQRHMAIRARGAGPEVDRPQLLRTRAKGYSYTIHYASPGDARRGQWGWHRTIFMFALPMRKRGLSVHSTGFILPGGRGVVCPGISGAGKSTLARLLVAAGPPGLTVLGDDRIAVTADDGGLHLWGTPWHSSAGTAVADDAPCAALVFIARGDGARLTPLAPREAMKRLIRTVAIPFWDPAGTDFALSMIDRMVTTVPCFEFAYAPTNGAVARLVDELSMSVSTRN